MQALNEPGRANPTRNYVWVACGGRRKNGHLLTIGSSSRLVTRTKSTMNARLLSGLDSGSNP